MDWQDLRHFLAVARTGSLSAAARELGVDHATVGRRVAALEADLGLRLIDRLPRRILLTAAGADILALGEGMEQAARGIERRARARQSQSVVPVRISAPPAVAARLVAPQVAAFRADHPDILLTVSGSSGLAAMDRGEADIAVRMARPEDPDLVARLAGRMGFGLYATSGLAALPAPEWRFVAYDAALDHLAQQAWLLSLLDGRPIVFRASDLFGELEAARAGMGAVVLPRFIGDAEPGLVPLKTASAPPLREIWLVTYPDLRRSAAIRHVLDFLGTVIAAACPPR